MRCGISTACFFPMETRRALEMVANSGAKVTEIFLNTFSELEDSYIASLQKIVQQAGMEVSAVHPFSSAMEGFFFASEYEGRLQDGLQLYRRLFAAARTLGAGKLVFHGDRTVGPSRFDVRQYAKNFITLAKEGEKFGVTLCHENVSYCRLGAPGAVQQLRPLLGPRAAFVLDIKQVRRFGVPVQQMVSAMGQDVRHVHISDFDEEKDCLPPGSGNFDFPSFVQGFAQNGYKGDFMIELYRDGFTRPQELVQAMRYIQALLPKSV